MDTVVYGLWRIERVTVDGRPGLRVSHGGRVVAECGGTEAALALLARGGVPMDQLARVAQRFGTDSA